MCVLIHNNNPTHLRGGGLYFKEVFFWRRILCEGDCILVKAKEEELFEVRAEAPLDLARAAYHLGNRHVALEFVNARLLRFPADPVLAEMLRGMGLIVVQTCAAFMPERGAYGQSAHSHDHHSHDATAHESDLFDPGHGAHRTTRKIHDFTDK